MIFPNITFNLESLTVNQLEVQQAVYWRNEIFIILLSCLTSSIVIFNESLNMKTFTARVNFSQIVFRAIGPWFSSHKARRVIMKTFTDRTLRICKPHCLGDELNKKGYATEDISLVNQRSGSIRIREDFSPVCK